MAGYNNRNGGTGPAGYATKADVILQREAEISGKIDMLLAAEKGNAGADALSDKIATEAAYISKQNSAIFANAAGNFRTTRVSPLSNFSSV